MLLDTKELAESTASIVKKHVAKVVEPLLKRIEELEAQIKALPSPQDGAPGPAGERGEPGPAGPVGPVPTSEQIREAVEEYFIMFPPEKGEKGEPGAPGEPGPAGPAGQPGEKGLDGKDGAPGEPGPQGEKGLDGKDGRDGRSLTKFIVGEDGNLVAVHSDGSTDDLGFFRGMNGKDGADGAKGEPGVAGRDGFGFEGINLQVDDSGVSLAFSVGEETKAFPLPIPFYHGVWTEKEYKRGACVTYGGSTWIALEDTSARPERGGKGWRLAVKRGQDGKDGVLKEPPSKAPLKL